MKKTFLAILLTLLVLTGCTAQNTDDLGIDAMEKNHNVTLEEAKDIALTHASLSKDTTEFVVEKLVDAKPNYYLLIMKNGNRTYVYKIETTSGKILVSSNQDISDDDLDDLIKDILGNVQGNDVVVPEVTPENKPSTNGEITADQAFEIALKDAGVSRSSVTHKEIERDKEDNVLVYEVEFEVGEDEYDYDIAISDGRIIKKSIDIKNKPSADSAISISKAKEIALAKVPGASENHISIERDTDDGRVEYEGTIIYNGYEYEFEIDGHTGAIKEWEVESIYD